MSLGFLPISDFPELVKQFNAELNFPNTIDNTPRWCKKTMIQWVCVECDHHFFNFPSNRLDNAGCSQCIGRVVHSDGRNSMLKVNPELASEFHPERNFPLNSSSIKEQYNKKLWWLCKICNHEWEASGNSRVNRKSGCPHCSGRSVHIDGRDSMETVRPDMADDFDYNENKPNTPARLKPQTNKKLHWVCVTCNHKELQAGDSRYKTGCRFCRSQSGGVRGIVHSSGVGSIADTHPKIASEFNTHKNVDPATNIRIEVETVLPGSHKKYWWKCNECQNEWQASVKNRTLHGKGCGFCGRNLLHSDKRNSMVKTHPKLASEFHPTKNGELKPENMTAPYYKHLWWICSTCEFEYPATGMNRVHHNSGCPSCSPGGFNANLPGFYYVNAIIRNDGEIICYKGGISNKEISVRFNQQKKSLNKIEEYKDCEYVNVEHIELEDGHEIMKLENSLKAIDSIRHPKIEGFDGKTELFVVNPLNYARITGILVL